MSNGEERPITFASRKMAMAEQNYTGRTGGPGNHIRNEDVPSIPVGPKLHPRDGPQVIGSDFQTQTMSILHGRSKATKVGSDTSRTFLRHCTPQREGARPRRCLSRRLSLPLTDPRKEIDEDQDIFRFALVDELPISSKEI